MTTTMPKAPAWTWWLLIGLVVVILFFGRIFGPKKRTTQTSQGQPAKQAVAVAQHLPLCAGGDYDFSKVEIPRKVVISYRPDCFCQVILPSKVTWRGDPSTDIEAIFWDGERYIAGPGKVAWTGTTRGIFNIHGLTQAGKMEIFLEKK